MVDFSKFKFNSNMKMDNVIFVSEQTFSNSDPDYTLINTTIPNPFNFVPLCFGNFSLDGGTTWQDIDSSSMTTRGRLTSNASTIGIYLLHETRVASVKVRIYAFAPSTVGNINFAKPTPISNFYINTENAYDNLVASGTASLSSSGSQQVVYTHNLGYIPRVMLWDDITGTGLRRVSSTGDSRGPIITTTQLKYLADTSLTVHYRIYGGKNG